MLRNRTTMQHHSITKLLLAASISSLLAVTTQADQLISDTLVVDGPVVMGLDAETGWNFGYDTLVLRENNLRIYFDDTSVGDSIYSSNDWRIAINDTTTNGASYFAIEDATGSKTPFKIAGGAINNAFYIGANGSVGLGTTSPHSQMKFHEVWGDTPGVRLEQNNSSGYTAQTWDVAGNEANFFIRDLTGGSRLCFRIRPGAPTSSIDIAATGDVGIGTDKPKAKLHVHVNTGEGLLIGNFNSNTNLTKNAATLHVDGTALVATRLGIGSTNVMTNSQALYVQGTAFISQTLEIGSSRTRKENIRNVTLEEAKETLKDLNPVQFNYIGDSEHQLGFIAEDVPDAVATQSRKSIVPMDFVAVLTKVVQDHERRETELQKTIDSQQQMLKTLSERLQAIEQRTSAASVQH